MAKEKPSRLPLSSAYTVTQALQAAQIRAEELCDVIVIGVFEDSELFVTSNRQSRADALWLLERARDHCLHGKAE